MSIVLNQELSAYAPNYRHADVLKTAKSTFCKRNRTLYRCIFPNVSSQKLNKTVLAAWDSSPETEKNIYISEVLGIFGGKRRDPMINPRVVEILNLEKHKKISVSCNSNAEEQPATDAASPSSKCRNKRPRRSTPKKVQKCSREKKQAPTAEEGESVLLEGFTADEMDVHDFALECMLEEECRLQFNGDTESIRQSENLCLAVETKPCFMDDKDFWSSIPTLDDLLLLDNDLLL